jgi:hypothetical protein
MIPKRHLTLTAFLLMSVVSSAAPALQRDPKLDLRSIPVADWLNEGKKTEIDWETGSRSSLRMDQRIELAYWATVSARALGRSGVDHELFLIHRFSTPDGEWLNETTVARRPADTAMPADGQIQFSEVVVARPGDYLLWMVLYDRKTGMHNTERLKIRVDPIASDPLPDLFAHQREIESTDGLEAEQGQVGAVKSPLRLSVENKRPIDVKIIGQLNPPDLLIENGKTIRLTSDATTSALAALSQMTIRDGTISVVGLNTTREEILLGLEGRKSIAWPALRNAFQKTEGRLMSVATGIKRRSNAAFFKDALSAWLALGKESASNRDFRVYIIITGPPQFDSETVITPLQPVDACNCRIYHLRLNTARASGVDDLAAIVKPLQARTFEVRTSMDLRKALAAIVEEVGAL